LLSSAAGSGPPTTASGPPPCEAFDAAFANGCVDCTCDSGAKGITDSLLPRSDGDGGDGGSKRDHMPLTLSAQVGSLQALTHSVSINRVLKTPCLFASRSSLLECCAERRAEASRQTALPSFSQPSSICLPAHRHDASHAAACPRGTCYQTIFDWQGTGSGTVFNGAWSNTTAGQTDTSSVSGSASRSVAHAGMPRLPPRVNTTIPPAAAVASLAAVRPTCFFPLLFVCTESI